MIIILRDAVISIDGGSQLVSGLTALTTVPRREVVLQKESWGVVTDLLVRVCYCRLVRRLRRYPPFCYAYMLLFYGVLRRSIEAKLMARFGGRGASAVWCPANELVPLLGSALARNLNCRLHVSITDLPETYVLHRV